MNRLANLHGQLGRLRRRRRAARWGMAGSILGLSALVLLVVLLLVDWTADLAPTARIVALGTAGAMICLAAVRWAFPWIFKRESELDVALMVEQLHHIDSDLVAALQFESASARQGSSPQLTAAVIDYVSDYSHHTNLEDAPPAAPVRHWAMACGLVAALVAITLVLYPYHWQAFANRMLLGSMHYPVRTHIDRVHVNGIELNLQGRGATPRSPYGQPLRFEVYGSGELPAAGRVELTTFNDSNKTALELTADPARSGVYVGQLPRLVDSVRGRVLLGDDWTEPCEVLAIPLPVVTIALDAEPPKYAASKSAESGMLAGARQISVVEGTRVAVRLECTNKALASATLTIDEKQFPLAPRDDKQHRWRLDPADTPLARVTEPVRYEIQVVDSDGLTLSEPIQGYIRIKSDRPPRVTAALVTQHVLPTGKPKIAYGAADDYGVAELRLNLQIVREDGTTREETVPVPVEAGPPKVVQGRYALDLAPLKLVKGDEVKLSLEACDYRGDQPGHWAVCEPLVLHVTDERGVLAAMSESDQRSAHQLEAIIQRQLGIGD